MDKLKTFQFIDNFKVYKDIIAVACEDFDTFESSAHPVNYSKTAPKDTSACSSVIVSIFIDT